MIFTSTKKRNEMNEILDEIKRLKLERNRDQAELAAFHDSTPKKACEHCGRMTHYIPTFNVKYCDNCELKSRDWPHHKNYGK